MFLFPRANYCFTRAVFKVVLVVLKRHPRQQMKPEQKTVELTEEEKMVLQHIKETQPAVLTAIKEKAGLSNKKWDKAIKGLGQKKVVQVVKNEEGLFVEVLK